MELSSAELLERNRALAAAKDLLMAEVDQRKRSEYRYSLAAQGANDGLWDWDVEAGRVYYSRRWKAMLGHEDDEIGDGLASGWTACTPTISRGCRRTRCAAAPGDREPLLGVSHPPP